MKIFLIIMKEKNLFLNKDILKYLLRFVSFLESIADQKRRQTDEILPEILSNEFLILIGLIFGKLQEEQEKVNLLGLK